MNAQINIRNGLSLTSVKEIRDSNILKYRFRKFIFRKEWVACCGKSDSRMDRSKQGFIDEDIRWLIETIKAKGFFPRSSCSGRIVLLRIPSFGDKRNCEWIFKSHEPVDFKDIRRFVGKERVYFLQEPPIIHVNCRNIQDAFRILDIARKAGFKHSGIISRKNYTVEIRGSERVETPLEGVSDSFLLVLVKEANAKLMRGKERLKRFGDMVERAL